MNLILKLIMILTFAFCSKLNASGIEKKVIELGQIVNVPHQKICASILSTAYEKGKITYHINILPGWRSIFETFKGNLDGEVCRYTKFAEEHPNLIKITPPIYFILPTVFSTKDLKLKDISKDTFKDYRVGIIKGLPGFEDYLSKVKNLESVNSIEQLIQMLLLDRIDLFITSRINAIITMKRMGTESKIKYSYSPEKFRTPLYHFLSNKFQSQATELQKILSTMEQSGELNILQKQLEMNEINQAKPQ
ncbi:transporter substrate-binding domain-containing protein [Pigmentibacter sp. JX0631]|uniref:substrate-binding periplasmic protein n=1 Tax=Pigmentibacter sp. JX0631 TaxID=2976982 RepID=UPI002469535D|nr:transporter substrate-binding domain-containing protein [Pigmentibacter sp. JX0631]WGL61428.1 transporter substrate-binding domain-containing protein [Pigmentibacter sp. JX0631]